MHCSTCASVGVTSKASSHPDSAKIRKILMILKEIDERSDASEKTIIFSQFTSMLDLLEPFLDKEGVKFVRCKCFHYLVQNRRVRGYPR